jgi:hypothetical protein
VARAETRWRERSLVDAARVLVSRLIKLAGFI